MRNSLDHDKITLVRASWENLDPDSLSSASLCCINQCAADPTIAHLFQQNMIKRSREVMQGITYILGRLHHPERLVLYLQSLGQLLRVHGVQETSQEKVGDALLQTLRQSLG